MLHDPHWDSLSLMEEPAHGVYCVTLHLVLKFNLVETVTLGVAASVIGCQTLDKLNNFPGQFFDA